MKYAKITMIVIVLLSLIALTSTLIYVNQPQMTVDANGNTYTCGDSDYSILNGGNNPNRYGELTLYFNGKYTKVRDYCSGGGQLAEFYCENDWSALQYYTCGGICKDGECTTASNQDEQDDSDGYIPPKDTTEVPTTSDIVSCDDDDGGNEPNKAGKLRLNYHGSISYIEDRCVDDEELIEYYCVDSTDWSGLQYWDCENGCSDGKCKTGTIGGEIGDILGGIKDSVIDPITDPIENYFEKFKIALTILFSFLTAVIILILMFVLVKFIDVKNNFFVNVILPYAMAIIVGGVSGFLFFNYFLISMIILGVLTVLTVGSVIVAVYFKLS